MSCVDGVSSHSYDPDQRDAGALDASSAKLLCSIFHIPLACSVVRIEDAWCFEPSVYCERVRFLPRILEGFPFHNDRGFL